MSEESTDFVRGHVFNNNSTGIIMARTDKYQ